MTTHGYCTLHKIAYNRTLDAVCPQCSVARITPFKQLDFDDRAQIPLDAAGKPVDVGTIVPAPI